MDEKKDFTQAEINAALDKVNRFHMGGREGVEAVAWVVSRDASGTETSRSKRRPDVADAIATAAAMATADPNGSHEVMVKFGPLVDGVMLCKFRHPIVLARRLISEVDPSDPVLAAIVASLGPTIMGVATQMTLARLQLDAKLADGDDGGGH